MSRVRKTDGQTDNQKDKMTDGQIVITI